MTGRPAAFGSDRLTVALLAAGTVLLPLQIWPPMPLPGMQLSDAVFALAFVALLPARGPLPPASAAVAMAAFAAGAAASALAGGGGWKLLGHFELAALGWMAATISPMGARALRGSLVAAAALAALTAMLGLLLYATGQASYDTAGVPDNPLLYIHGALVSDGYPRPRGTLVTGAMLTSLVASGLALLWFERALVPWRGLRVLVLAAGAIAMVFAFNRSIATLFVVIAGAELWRRDRPAWLRGAFLAGGAVYASALWISLRYHVLLNPLEPWAVEVLAGDGDRFARWRIAVAVIAEHPLLGLGPGVRVADGWEAHNTWLNLWAGIGIVPLIAVAALLFGALRRAFGAGSIGLGCALAFVLIESTYNDIEDMRHVWLLIGLALSAARLQVQPDGDRGA